MSFRLDQLLKASTVRISTAGKAYEGMGFFFAPGLALTSAHVVHQAEGEMVQVFLPGEQHAVPAEVKYRFPEDVGLIILQVQTTEALPCAYLDADIKPGDQGYTFGCTGTSRKVHRVMVECEGMMGGAIGISQLAGRSKHLRINGAPVLNQRTGKVCGIVHTPKKGKTYRGEAVPMGIIFSEFPALSILQKEYHCQDNRWTTLLHPDLEALDGDWSYYNRGWIRREQSIRALLFLLRSASQWALIGARMRHVFPWRSIISLIKATFRGNLGTEIQRQYEYITRQIASNIDPHSTSQARALHRVDAQSWVVTSLMEMLISPEQDYASTSRLLWMLEILQEQRVYIQTLKRMPGNFYPQLETFKRKWKLLEHDEKYIDTSRVLSGLINRHTDTNFSLWYTIKFFLKDFILDLAQNSKLSAHGLERLFNMLVVNLRHAVPAPTSSVEDLLRDLEEEVRQNPDLKVLQKVQLLMTSVSGELVQGGRYRAFKGSNTYHFSDKCKLYPERVPAEELSRIICYETEAEARQAHKPCKNCLNAERMLDRRLSDWHDGDAAGGELVSGELPTSDTPAEVVAKPKSPELPPLPQPALSASGDQTVSNQLSTDVPSGDANPVATDANVTVLPIVQNQPTSDATASPAVVDAPAPTSNLLTPDFRAADPIMQVPVTERAITEAPAADAPMPDTVVSIEQIDASIAANAGSANSATLDTTVISDAEANSETEEDTVIQVLESPSESIQTVQLAPFPIVQGDDAQLAMTSSDVRASEHSSEHSVDDSVVADQVEAELAPTEPTPSPEVVVAPEEAGQPVVEAAAAEPPTATEVAMANASAPLNDALDSELEDEAVLTAEVEVELSAAIAEVAQEIAAEAAQAAVVAQPTAATVVLESRESRLATTDVDTTAALDATVGAADLHELNTDELEEADEGFEMAAFFVPDGDQPAIDLTEASVSGESLNTDVNVSVVAADLSDETSLSIDDTSADDVSLDGDTSTDSTPTVETAVVPQVADAPPAKSSAKTTKATQASAAASSKSDAKAAKSVPSKTTKTTSRKSRSSKTKKTLKDFVAELSASKSLDTGTTASSTAKSKTAKAKAAPTGTVKTGTAKTKTTKASSTTPATAAKSAKTAKTGTTAKKRTQKTSRTKTAAKATVEPSKSVKVSADQISSSSKTANSVTAKPATTKSAATKSKSAKSAKSAAMQSGAAQSTTEAAQKSTKSKVTKTKAPKSKVARLADWATPDEAIAPSTPQETDAPVVDIAEAKSARRKKQAATKRTAKSKGGTKSKD